MAVRSLLSTVKVDAVTPFHLDRIRVIDDTDFGFVRRKVREEMEARGTPVSDEYLDEGVLALQQYYLIAVLDPDNMHAVSDVVDPFWHAHILDTRAYAQFCEQVVGGFMHHVPLDHENFVLVQGVGVLYEYTVRCYDRFYTYVNEQLFPRVVPAARLICFHGGRSSNAYDSNVVANALLPRNPAMQEEVLQLVAA